MLIPNITSSKHAKHHQIETKRMRKKIISLMMADALKLAELLQF